MTQPAVITPHTADSTREIVNEAVKIADEFQRDSIAWQPVFEQACRLLGTRHVIAVEQEQVNVVLPGMRVGG